MPQINLVAPCVLMSAKGVSNTLLFQVGGLTDPPHTITVALQNDGGTPDTDYKVDNPATVVSQISKGTYWFTVIVVGTVSGPGAGTDWRDLKLGFSFGSNIWMTVTCDNVTSGPYLIPCTPINPMIKPAHRRWDEGEAKPKKKVP